MALKEVNPNGFTAPLPKLLAHSRVECCIVTWWWLVTISGDLQPDPRNAFIALVCRRRRPKAIISGVKGFTYAALCAAPLPESRGAIITASY